jgi:hypothetical protein
MYVTSMMEVAYISLLGTVQIGCPVALVATGSTSCHMDHQVVDISKGMRAVLIACTNIISSNRSQRPSSNIWPPTTSTMHHAQNIKMRQLCARACASCDCTTTQRHWRACSSRHTSSWHLAPSMQVCYMQHVHQVDLRKGGLAYATSLLLLYIMRTAAALQPLATYIQWHMNHGVELSTLAPKRRNAAPVSPLNKPHTIPSTTQESHSRPDKHTNALLLRHAQLAAVVQNPST